MRNSDLRLLTESYYEIYENKFYDEVIDALISENIVNSYDEGVYFINEMTDEDFEEVCYLISEMKEKLRRAELRAYSLENKRGKEVENLKQGTKEYLKKYRGYVTAGRAKRYYSGRPAPSDVTSDMKSKAGYRAPRTRLN